MAGDGTYVQVTEDHIDLSSPRELVTERFDNTLAYAEEWKVISQNSLGTLTDYLTEFSMPSGWMSALDDVALTAITVPEYNQRTPPGPLVLPDDWPDDFPTLPGLASSPVTDFSYTKPVKPDQVSPSMDYTPGVYSSTMYTAVYNSIYTYLQNPAIGVPETIWTAIAARRRYNHALATAEKYAADMRAAGATGFEFADGMIAGIQEDASMNILMQDDDTENAILIQSSELAQKMQMFAVEKGLQLEQLLRDFYNNYENRSLEANKTISQFIIQVYAENVKGYIAEWEGVKAELEAKISVVELVIKENTLIIEGFKAEAAAYVANVEAVSKKTDGIVRGFEGEVAGYEAQVKADTSYYQTLTEIQKAQIEYARIKLEKAVAELKALLDSQVSFDTLKANIAEKIGSIAQQAVSGALNAVNASASLGFTASESMSEDWKHSDSINESHSTEHDEPV